MCHTISNKYILYVYMVVAIELGQNGPDWVAKLEGQIHVQPSLTTAQVQPEPALIVSQPYSTALPELNVRQPIEPDPTAILISLKYQNIKLCAK